MESERFISRKIEREENLKFSMDLLLVVLTLLTDISSLLDSSQSLGFHLQMVLALCK